MRELDKNKVYDLSELTIEERKEIDNYVFNLQPELKQIGVSEFDVLAYDTEFVYWTKESKKPTTNAKELFYTLENIQVDCRELSEEEINNMKTIVENSGYETNNVFYRNINYQFNYYFFKSDNNKTEFYFGEEVCYKTTITYDKFMELFGRKEENFKKLVEVLNEELTEEAYKETEYEVKYIAEKPKQYQIGIDTFERCEANMTKEEILACVRFNIDKYTWRNKGQDLEDLEKIISYANWAIKLLKVEK